MTESLQIGPLGPLDLAALALLVVSWMVIGWMTEHSSPSRPSMGKLMAGYRREWMRQLVTRQPRIFDSAMVDGLRQSTTFFASTSLLAIGAGLALIANPQPLANIASDFALDRGPDLLWEARILTAVLFGANAFLKFVWSHRLFSYAAIAMAAVPNDPQDPLAYPRAAQAAQININAAKSFNRGLRSVYFALATLAWLLGPYALIGAVVFTTGMLWRREFASDSRQALLENRPD
ncbi:MAG: DUF599 domain-containing protein [Thioclava marina]|jgi:uncharacterized membrane protein|uniref:DUF599 domain-containing protein n=1 Tax=Thioclava marina TaxID=1915077 RepID=A0ABX3MJF3_9RHOB|nr:MULTISPECIES: DUF599 domain-containing protein [Thioclava]TNE84476.1 MAG: DUF599 domain-containing protein [Paracoccaceae bacterium]MBC7146435.1 DUF599 domain-containing protein [Thioclava marina]MBD3803348.1 DUF599 domain-containing protein [Thioclava sp.]OOY11691.1 hypothetical protein BMG00_11380 [Thioclava marina]OOY27498.1 hypothetical protein BMI90_12905 [Thioclava sp. L04-15]